MFPALDRIARQKAGKGEEWSVYAARVYPMPPKQLEGVYVTGANHRPLTRGPRKGELTWGSEGKATAFITAAEYRAACTEKETPDAR